MFPLKQQFLVDENGVRTAVVLDIDDYYRLLDRLDELDDSAAHDAAPTRNGDAASQAAVHHADSPHNGAMPNGVGEVMTFEEMGRRFEGEWVIVGEPELTPSLMIIHGVVVWHGVDTDELYQKRRELDFANIVHWYFSSKSPSTKRHLVL